MIAVKEIYNQKTPRENTQCSGNFTGYHRFIYSLLDAVPPIHAESSHVATDKVPSM